MVDQILYLVSEWQLCVCKANWTCAKLYAFRHWKEHSQYTIRLTLVGTMQEGMLYRVEYYYLPSHLPGIVFLFSLIPISHLSFQLLFEILVCTATNVYKSTFTKMHINSNRKLGRENQILYYEFIIFKLIALSLFILCANAIPCYHNKLRILTEHYFSFKLSFSPLYS